MADAPIGPLDPTGAPVPHLLCDAEALAARAPAQAGALWRLTEPSRQLDANLIRLPPDEQINTHIEPDLDVLLLVVNGDGVLGTALAPQPLSRGSLIWLPRGSSRSLTAGRRGMSYLTVHRRRSGMQIGSRPNS